MKHRTKKTILLAVALAAAGCGSSPDSPLFGSNAKGPGAAADAGGDATTGGDGTGGRDVDGSTGGDPTTGDGPDGGPGGRGDGSTGDTGGTASSPDAAAAAEACPVVSAGMNLVDCSSECDPKTFRYCEIVRCNSAHAGDTNLNFSPTTDTVIRTPANPHDGECTASCLDWPPAPPVAPAFGIGMHFSTTRKFRVRAPAPYMMQELGHPNSRNPPPVFCPWDQGDGGTLTTVCAGYPKGLHDTLVVWTNDRTAPERNVYLEFDQDCP